MIVIVDYGLGNLLSVSKAFEEVADGKKVIISRSKAHFEKASHIVLPGVGNFRVGMKKLNTLNLIPVLENEIVVKKKPFLGICLGMQLLAEEGHESGVVKGLGWINGVVRKIRTTDRLPHIGWDDVSRINTPQLFKTISMNREFYFVHNYIVDCPAEYVIATCSYGETFTAAIQKENIVATQFHPEKSRTAGLSIMKNFLRMSC